MIVRLVFHPCTKIQQKFERYHICRLHWLVLSNHRYSRTAHYPSGLFSLVRVSIRIIGKFSSTFSHTFHNSFTLLVHYWKKVFFYLQIQEMFLHLSTLLRTYSVSWFSIAFTKKIFLFTKMLQFNKYYINLKIFTTE